MMRICEVGPRDGLQNEKRTFSVQDKVDYIHALENAGLDYIEVGAFVRADKVPQMADTDQVIQNLQLDSQTQTCVLVPNLKGYQKAVENGVQEVAIFTAASETFNQKNINASIEESIARFEDVFMQAKEDQVQVRGYVSTCFVCPFEGEISVKQVLPVIEKLLEMGCYEVSIGDTIGKASTTQVKQLFSETNLMGWNDHLAGHFHDTYGHAVQHIRESMTYGIETFDASSGGIGGCPYAPGAPGNVATEDVVMLLDQEGIEHPIDIEKLKKASSILKGTRT